MPKWYLNPDGTFPLDADGKPMFVSEAQFKGCCCNMCQWRRKFEWDCEEEEWAELDYGEEVETDGEWIPAEHEPGESDTLCTRTVWGEIVNCLVDPKPEPPAPEVLTEEEIEECCPLAPCTCPEDVLSQYQVNSMTWIDDTSVEWWRYTLKNPVTITSSSGCFWFGSGTFKLERSFDGGSTWSDEGDVVWGISLDIDDFVFCRWVLRADFFFRFQKRFGPNPTGTYKRAGSNVISGSASVS